MKTKLKSILAVALCAVGLTASALSPSPYRDFWSSHPDPQPVKDPANVIDWGTASMTFESLSARHGKFLAAAADAMIAEYTARIEKDPTDCEAHICRALAYLKKAGENQAFDRLAKEFGYTFDNDTMHMDGKLIHEKGVTPEMNAVSDEVCGILLPLMKAAYADLCAIPKNWAGSVAITPDVYPVDEAAYFDYADSLGARAALAELMCVLNMVKGFDVAMDSDKLEYTFDAKIPSLEKRGVGAIFENNPEFFSKVRDQKALTEAGDWWASAATLLDQWDKAHCRRSDDKLHFFDWNYYKLDSNGTYGLEWLRRQSVELANLPYWASPLDYTKINGDDQQFTSFKPLFGGKVLRANLPEFGVGVKAPYCNEPLIDTCPDSTICGMWPSVSPTYLGEYISTRWTDIPAYTDNRTAPVYGIWYKNMFDLGFDNEGNPLTFAWDNATPIRLLDPEFNVRGVTAVFKGWSGAAHDGNTPITFEGKEIPTPIGEPMKYEWRRVELTANFGIPKVTYLDLDEKTGKPVERTVECELVTPNTTEFTTGKVYAVAGNVTVANRITVWSTPENPAKLVLCDGATLWATNGVEVDVRGTATNALVICGQALGTGTLESTGYYNHSGIGGGGGTTGKGAVCGIVTINGGTVIAKGGYDGAGIGGGAQLIQKGVGGTVTINRGTVIATGGDYGAGIGGGHLADGGTVTINGGTVTATGGGGSFFGAGIGAGYNGESHGTVKFGAGIASGVEAGELERRGGYTKPFYMTTAEYVADHHLQYVMLPCYSLKIPEATEGYSYEVSYEGAQPNAVLADGTNTYAIAAGATARVRFTLDRGYMWADESFDNPIIIASISEDTVIDLGDLPTAAPAPAGYWNNPWEIGSPVAADVVAYTNWVDGKLTLVVEGKGAMKDMTNPPPWDDFGGSIQSVEVGTGVTMLGKNAFANLTNLSEASLPEGLLDIGEKAFYSCSDALAEVTIPSTVTNIGATAFYNCRQIQSLTVPGSVWAIGENAFAICTSLTRVEMESYVPPVAGKAPFSGHNPDLKIYVPNGSGAAYKAAPVWSDYADSIVELGSPECPWEVGSPNAADVLAYMDGTGKLVIEGTGKMKDFNRKGDPAPWGTAITEVEIGEGVTSIGAKAFAKCTSLSDVVVKATTPPALGADAFAGTAGDLKIAVPLGTSAAYKAAPGWSDYANRIAEQGSSEYPWTVGKTADDSVTAYVDDTGKLVIAGKGAMKAFNGKTDPTPWGTGITKVEIGEDVTSIGANAFSGSTALTDVTLKTTRPPVVGMNAFKGCDALEAINVPLWSSGAYKHADTWSNYADGIVEPKAPKIWAEGHRIASDKQVGVCSWTWHGSISNVLEQMEADGRYNGMQLALAPWLGIDSESLYFGDQEGPEVWEFIKERVADGSLNVMSTMINFPKEDYTTLTSITNTQGYMYGVAEKWADAEEQWKTNLYFTAEAARLSKELGVDTLSTEAGFIIVNETLMFDRMKEVCMTCAVHGVQLLIESGPQNSLQLTNLLVNLEKEGYTNVGINFDPGDTELFGSENPVDSFKIMKPWIRMIHVKDCKENDRSKKGWNEDCVWGDGVVSQMDFHDNKADPRHFLEQLTAEGYAGDILYERLSGDETLTPARKEEITQAMDRIFAALPEPIAAESDEFTVDLRTRVEFEEGKTRIDVVTWSATAWGAVPGSKYTDLGFTNKTTGATGVIAEGLVGENLDDCPLPEKDGEYLLTHSTGDLKSFVTFVVSGYPIGGETNPWTVGPADDPEATFAWKDGKDSIVYFKPPRSAVSRTGLETLTNAMGGVGFDMLLVSADRSATNDVKMIIGASGTQYKTLEEMLESDEDSWTLYDVTGCVVNYDGRGAAGEMRPDTFLPDVPTNLTANAFTAVGYTFQGWTTNGAADKVVFKDKAKIDDPQPGDIYDLKAVWKSAPLTVRTFEQLQNALDAAAEQGSELPVTLNVSGTITVPSDKKVEVPGDPTKAMVRLTGSGSIKGYVKTGGNLDVGSVKILPWTVGSGVTAYIDENGTLHIEGNGKMKDFTEANPAPWGDVASDIKAIDVAEGVTKVGNAAFAALDYKATTTALTFQDEDHVLNLLAFVSEDGSVTNVPSATAFSVYKDSSGTVEPIEAFMTQDKAYMWTAAVPLMRLGYDEVLLLTLPDLKAVQTAELVEAAGEQPYSKAMQGLLYEALDKIDKATSLDEILDGYDERLAQIEAQAEKDESHEIKGEGYDITWRVMDGELVLNGEGEMPDFVAPDFPEGAPWNEMKADITNVTVAAGITSVGDAAFAISPAFEESSVLFKDPEIELNLGAFVSGDGSVTNVPTVRVEIVTEDGRKLRVIPGGWTDAASRRVYETLEEAIEDGAGAVIAAFEKATDEGENAVPPAEVEEVVKTVPDPDDPEKEIELAATYENVPTDGGSTTGLVSEIENLPLIVDNTGSNITVVVTATNKNEVAIEVVKEMDGAMSNECEIVKALLAPDVATENFDSSYLDMSAFFSFKNDSGRLVEFTKSIIAHIPMKLYDGQIYSVSRQHNGKTEVLPMWYEGIDDDEEVAATNEWVKADVANQELVVKTRRFCDYALGELELEKTCTIYVKNGSKTLGEADPSSLATNVEIVVTGPVNKSDFAGYAKRVAGEALGEYPINYVLVKKVPQGFPADKYTVHPGVFEIVMGGKLPAEGTVRYPATYKVSGYDTGLLREKTIASWTATAAKGSVFAGWVATNDAPACVTNHIAAFSENERRKSPLSFKVEEGEQIRPTDVAATWARIDEDTIDGVTLVTNAAGMLVALDVETLSYVTATVSGLPTWYAFDAKTLKVTERANVTRRDAKTYTVKVSVRNASGYTWKQDFAVGFVSGTGAVTSITPVADEDAHCVAVMVRCDPAAGTVNGTGVYALTQDRNTGVWSKQVSVSATAKAGYVFAGWYADPGFSEPAEFFTGSGTSRKPRDYRETSQTLTVTEPTYLFARFVEKTTKADPISWLRYSTAAYAKGETSLLAPEDADVWMQGVTFPETGCAIAFGSASKPTVTVTGLPAGTRYDATYCRFTGIPTRAGTNTVKITVRNMSGATDVLTRTIVVLPLPAWAVGNFGGVVADAAETTHGTAQMTVSSVGRVSGKFAQGGTNWTYSANAYADWIVRDGETFFTVVATSKYAKIERVLKLTVAAEAPRAEDYRIGEAVAEGAFGADKADLRRIVWSDAGAKALNGEYAGAYDYWTAGGTKYAIKFAANGKATLAGKTAEGRSISLTADVLTDRGAEIGSTGRYAMRLVAPFYAAPAKTYSSVLRATVQMPEFFESPELCNVSAAAPVPGELAVRQAGAITTVDRTAGGFGCVNVSPAFGQAKVGQALTFSTVADRNSTFVRWVVTDADGDQVDLYGDEYAKTLKLVADGRDVTVKAVFADKYAAPVVPTIDADGLAYVLTNLFVGVKVDYLVQIPEAARPATFTARNLPAGLKIDSVTGRITGVPTKAGLFEGTKAVTITATGAHLVRPTDTVTCAAEVQELAAWAQGSFDGSFIGVDVEVAPGVTNRYTGSTTFTVSNLGRITGTAKTDLGNITFSAASFDRVDQDGVTPVAYWVDLEGSLTYNRKTVKVPFAANVKISGTTGLGVIGYNGDRDCAVQNPWKSRKDLDYPSFPTGAAALSLTDGNLTLKFGANGAVTISGTVPGDNGTPVSASGSSQVQPAIWNGNTLTAYVEVFVAPKTSLAVGFFKEYEIYLTSDGNGKFVSVTSAPPPPPPPPPGPTPLPDPVH